MVETIGVPFDLCGPHHGSRLGPVALRLEGLADQLRDLGVEARDGGDVWPLDGRTPGSRTECDEAGLEVYARARDRVASVIAAGDTPVVIGGDHSVSIGSIAGALRAFGDGLSVLWIDAHMDVNTPDTTPSGNLHGMPLGVVSRLLPLGGPDPSQGPWAEAVHGLWPRLLDIVGEPGLARVAWLGVRDVDAGEVRNLGRLPDAMVKTMQDIDTDGLLGAAQAIDAWLRETETTALWVSFDADVLDPVYAPGTGTAVRGGLTYREGHLLAETLCSFLADPFCPYVLAGLDVVEVNPLRDSANETARVALEWIGSFFGKTILHGRHPGRTERST